MTIPFMSNASCVALSSPVFVPGSVPVSSVRAGAYDVSGCVSIADALVSLRDAAPEQDALSQKWATVGEDPCDAAGVTCLHDDDAKINALFG